PDNVLVNSVLPGLIRTDMWEKAAGEIASRNNLDKEAVFEHNSSGVPQKRYGTADEIASMVTFLCSEAASYCNGACFTVDGGSSSHI
ncbi:MAG: SDR family oxidoreductase, partial [Gammaproteobacteria bacterium]